jgi:hypothetical protein
VAIVAPQSEQAMIIRNYLAELMFASDLILEMAELESIGLDRLKKESTHQRQTFKNGSEYRVFSAFQEANRLMGFGVNGRLITDESSLISNEAWGKILRMLGDDPASTKHIALANPWDRGNKYYEFWTNPDYTKIHVDYKLALAEGRITEEFIKEMEESLTPVEFQVLYKSEFPDESIDAIFSYKDVLEAQERILPQWVTNPFKTYNVNERKIVGVDVARLGNDETVFCYGVRYEYSGNYFYEIKEFHSFSKQDTMTSIGKLMQLAIKEKVDEINIDCIGLGSTFFDRTKEVVAEKNLSIVVRECNFGEGVSSDLPKAVQYGNDPSKRFLNKKAEQYERASRIFKEGLVSIPKEPKFVRDINGLKWDFTSSEKAKVVDPDKSPDFADALVYCLWKEDSYCSWFFG